MHYVCVRDLLYVFCSSLGTKQVAVLGVAFKRYEHESGFPNSRKIQFLFLFIWAYTNTTTGGYFSSYSCLYGHTPIQLQEDTSVPIPVYMGIHQYNYRRILQFLFMFIWAYINTTTGGYFSSYSCLYGHTPIQLQEDLKFL